MVLLLTARARVLFRLLSVPDRLAPPEVGLGADTKQTERLLCGLLYVALMVHEEYGFCIHLLVILGLGMALENLGIDVADLFVGVLYFPVNH